jgi:hypothetical protein
MRRTALRQITAARLDHSWLSNAAWRRTALAVVAVTALFVVSSPHSAASASCDYYASPDGGGDGSTSATPFTIQGFWAVASPGKTLCLLDGVYQGATNLIQPPPGLSGTGSAPITIQALNDGGALLDGQFTNVPVLLRANSWWVLQGFNAKNGGPVVIYLGYGFSPSSDHNVLRRLVAWDADGTKNAAIAEHYNANENLWEDIGIFGMGRNAWEVYVGQNNVCRRCWVRVEGNMSNSGPVQGFQLAYGHSGNPPLAAGTMCENCLGTWWAGSMPESYRETDGAGNDTGVTAARYEIAGQPVGPFFSQANPGECNNVRVFGSLSYVKATDFISSASSPSTMFGMRYANCQTVRDVFVVVPPAYPTSAGIVGFSLGDGAPTTGNVADRITSVLSYVNVLSPEWVVTNYAADGNNQGVPSPWVDTGSGAGLCYRYLNGTPTTTPLWPWPMSQRIRAATTSAGAYAGPCKGCSGGRQARTATDVQADIEAVLGAVPAQCKGS